MIRLGIVRLADSAPAVAAERHKLFEANGLDVVLSVEPSWANVADKLAWGALDAAILLTPLALALRAGLGRAPIDLRIAMGINRGGNSVVFGHPLSVFDDPSRSRAAFADWISQQPVPPRFGVVHRCSMHNLLLREWLAEGGIDPDRDVEIVVVPPDQCVDALDAGRIVGFCAGAPWGERADELGAGRIVVATTSVRPNHIEKCLVVAPHRAHAPHGAPIDVDRLAGAMTTALPLADPAHVAERLDLPMSATRTAWPKITFTAEMPAADLEWIEKQFKRWVFV